MRSAPSPRLPAGAPRLAEGERRLPGAVFEQLDEMADVEDRSTAAALWPG